MIELKDLVHRDYKGKECYSFDYILNFIIFRFEKSKKIEEYSYDKWTMRIILPDDTIMKVSFEVPKNNLSLQMICAIGLKYYQNFLKSEIQVKSELDFTIGEKITGMFG